MFGLLMLLIIGIPLGVLVYCTEDWFDDVVWKICFYIVVYLVGYNVLGMIF